MSSNCGMTHNRYAVYSHDSIAINRDNEIIGQEVGINHPSIDPCLFWCSVWWSLMESLSDGVRQRQGNTLDKQQGFTLAWVSHTPPVHVFGLWEKVGEPGENPRSRDRGWGMLAGYLVGRPGSGLVLVVGEDEERQCAELRVLQGGMELVASSFEILVWRSAVQDEDHALRALVVTTPVLLDIISPCGRHNGCSVSGIWASTRQPHCSQKKQWRYATPKDQRREGTSVSRCGHLMTQLLCLI